MFPQHSKHDYRHNDNVVSKRTVQVMDDNGFVGYETEVVNLQSDLLINTPHYDVMSIENQVNAGQPIKRVSTVVLGDSVPSEAILNNASDVQPSNND